MKPYTFLWHDYETFGAAPRYDRPSQFAAIRTDSSLCEVDEPIMLFCKPTPDYIPHPEAVMLTGITPMQCLEQGINEVEFIQTIDEAMRVPNTISVGYNSMKFDDEVTRFTLWRNLKDAYAREWQNGCNRWDLIHLVQATYALRPEGIEWPVDENGDVSLRLEALSKANGLAHEHAHDALSDVRATIGLARLIQEQQPKLFDYALGLRRKDEVNKIIDMEHRHILLHVSGMYGKAKSYCALVWPLARHPKNQNEIIVWDLAYDPHVLLSLNAEEIQRRIFSPNDALAEGERLPIKTIHVNQSPFVVNNLKVLRAGDAERLGLDIELAKQYASHAAGIDEHMINWRTVFVRAEPDEKPDADVNLYGGFPSNTDRALLNKIQQLSPHQLARFEASFDNAEFRALLFRFRARNYPETLAPEETAKWMDWCRYKQSTAIVPSALTIPACLEIIEVKMAEATAEQQALLNALYLYLKNICLV